MKAIYVLIINLIVGINFTTCQNIYENKRHNETNINLIFNNANCDSIIRVIESKYFTIDSELINSIINMESSLKEYNSELFQNTGIHLGNLCFDLQNKVEAYKFSINSKYPSNNVGRLIALLSLNDSIYNSNYIAIPILFSNINSHIETMELDSILCFFEGNTLNQYCIGFYILNSYYSLSDEKLLKLIGKSIPLYRNQSSYTHMILHLIEKADKSEYAKKLLMNEYQWMKTDSTFLKYQIAGLIKDVELKLKSE
ncbi:MAG TPA: hypothetical protein PKD32_09655 [Saprospiraceae bacterium]|nr:hypothetical protein [Saprospiraceae bacterium]